MSRTNRHLDPGINGQPDATGPLTPPRWQLVCRYASIIDKDQPRGNASSVAFDRAVLSQVRPAADPLYALFLDSRPRLNVHLKDGRDYARIRRNRLMDLP